MNRLTLSTGLALGLVLGLAGCSNDPARSNQIETVRGLATGLFQRRAQEPQPLAPEDIAAFLSASSEPVVYYQSDTTKAQVLFQRIQQNGPYDTYATAWRNSLTLRDGVITGTRGLGGDLMSSEADALLAVLRSGGNGSAAYAMEYLDGENASFSITAECTLSRGQSVQVAIALVNEPAHAVTAVCRTPDRREFTNTFLVASDGYVLGARQWLGDWLGYVNTQQLRR